jgi:hypothetical protein
MVKVNNLPVFYPDGKEKNIIYNGLKIEYEDIDNMKDVVYD